MRRLLTVLGSAFCLVLGLAGPAGAAKPTASTNTLPSSMASTGDSITRAFDATSSGCFLSDCPQYSWSTGTSTAVTSQYQRIVKKNRKISGNGHNNAVTGAKMGDLDRQLQVAASQSVDYVTVLMGANDLCTSSTSTMTPTATFQSQFQTALTNYFAARPSSKMFVSSIPNIYQLWSVLHTNFSAVSTWTLFGICQAMLSTSNSSADRQAVVAQEAADNNVLATVCAQFANCRWDGYATYNTAFSASDVSTVDYFHPSIQGQNKLASVTWAASYWG